MQIFLSYSREDQSIARRFAEGLEREGFSVWWDEALHPGEAFDQVTERALEEARAVVVLWSKTSVSSRWVRAEATQANANNRLVPVTIEPCKRPIMFELIHTADLSSWRGDGVDPLWRSFVSSLRRFIDHAPREAMTPERSTIHAAMPVGARDATPGSQTRYSRSRRMALTAAGLVLLLLIGAAAYWWLASHAARAPTRSPTESADRTTAIPLAAVTLAVLPLANESANKDQDFIADGLTDALANQLSQIPRLRVTGIESSSRFKGSSADARAIAKTLNVDHLLSGVVQLADTQWRVTVRLVDASDGAQRWSKAYQRDASKVFSLYEEIARDVAQAVGIALDVSDLPRAQGGTTNVEAYRKFLHASMSNQVGTPVLDELREAVRLDPDFTAAWIALYASIDPAASTQPASVAAALRQEREEVAARLEAMPMQGDMLLWFRGQRLWRQHRWAELITLLEADAKSHFRPSGQLGLALMSVGRYSDAVPVLQRALVVSPLWANGSGFLRTTLIVLGREAEERDEAERFRGLLKDEPQAPIEQQWRIMRADGSAAEARGAFKALIRRAGKTPIEGWRIAGFGPEALSSDETAVAALHRAIDNPANQSESTLLSIATAAQVFGDADLAVTALRRDFVDLQNSFVPAIWYFPRARTERRFKDLVRDLGLLDYWRRSGQWGDFCKPVGANDFECR